MSRFLLAAASGEPSLTTTVVLLASLCLSLVSSAAVCVLFFAFRALRRHPASLVLWRCVADAAFCSAALISHVVFRGRGEGSDASLDNCRAYSFVVQATSLAAELYFLALSVDLSLSMTNPFTDVRRNMRTYHAVTWAVSLGSAAALVLANTTTPDTGASIRLTTPMKGRACLASE